MLGSDPAHVTALARPRREDRRRHDFTLRTGSGAGREVLAQVMHSRAVALYQAIPIPVPGSKRRLDIPARAFYDLTDSRPSKHSASLILITTSSGLFCSHLPRVNLVIGVGSVSRSDGRDRGRIL